MFFDDVTDNGKTIIVHDRGFYVSLKGNFTTGYLWLLEEKENENFIFTEESYVADNDEAIGGGGTVSFCFNLLKPGITKVSFVHKRPWLEEVDKSFSINLDIRF
jgi:predicted secreted protein